MTGWRRALESAGRPVPEPVTAGWLPVDGYEAGRAVAADPGVTSVLCGNDDLAAGMLRALRESGRRVPEDVSVVGFDDAPVSGFLSPALTTVRLDFVGLGRDCFQLLRQEMDPGSPRLPRLAAAPELVVRDSTAPPPG